MKKIKFDKRLKKGFFVADYFKKTSKIIKTELPNTLVTMQFFQRQNNVILCGIEQVVQLLKFACPNFRKLTIWSLSDGDLINANEPVLKIEGNYADFGWLEGVIDGILARSSSIATNSFKIVSAAGEKKVLNMMDRADTYLTLESDGYASYIGGMRLFVTEAALSWIDDLSVDKPSGTMPHALIQAYKGDIIKATEAFKRNFPDSRLLSLIDYNNDCVKDAVKVANYFGEELWAIRIDTSANLTDKFLQANKHKYPVEAKLNGVNKFLIKEVRQALDEAGHSNVLIIVSSGLDETTIKEFENEKVPIDIYGVGAYLAKITIGFTGDAVLINGQKEAKFGRALLPSSRLQKRK